jgi:hypothetical protein
MTVEIIACIGLTFILKYGSILNWPRRFLCKISFFRELFKCSLCLGFWSGIIVSIILFNFKYTITTDMLLLPFVSAGISWISDSVVTILQYIELKLEKDLDL